MNSLPIKENEKFTNEIKNDLADFYFQFKELGKKIGNIEKSNHHVAIYIYYNHAQEFQEVRTLLLNTQQFRRVYDFLKVRGIKVEELVYVLDYQSTIAFITPTDIEEQRFSNLMKDLYAVTDFKKIKEFQDKKLKASPAFKEFYNVFYSEEAQDLFKNLLENPQVDKSINIFEKYGIPMFDYQLFCFTIQNMMV